MPARVQVKRAARQVGNPRSKGGSSVPPCGSLLGCPVCGVLKQDRWRLTRMGESTSGADTARIQACEQRYDHRFRATRPRI